LLALCFVFGLALAQIDAASLWADETWSIWVAQRPWPQLLRSVAGDVHPPFFFAMLKGWLALAGKSAFAVRFHSLAWGMLGLAVTFALGRRLLDGWTALLVLIWLGAHGFLLYYLREARMYSLVFALSALSMWTYVQWRRQPTRTGWLAYAVVTAMLAYVHYLGVLVVVAQGIHQAITGPRRFGAWLLACGLALLLFLPWVPTLLAQATDHPAGPHQMVTPTNWPSIRHLLWVLSGGAGLFVAAPLVLGAFRRIFADEVTVTGRKGDPVDQPVRRPVTVTCLLPETWLLLSLWAVAPPAILLVANAWLTPLYEVRNVIGVLPAIALVVGAGLRQLAWPPLAAAALALLVAANLAFGPALRPPKSPWRQAFETVGAARTPGTPTLLKVVEPASPEAYYVDALGLRDAQTIELPGRSVDPLKIKTVVASLPANQGVWAIMPGNTADSWLVLAELARTHTIGLRQAVDYLLFYRFDPGAGLGLQLHLGEQFRFAGDNLGAVYNAKAGEQLCFETPLVVLSSVEAVYAYGLQLIDRRPGLVAQVDQGIGAHRAGSLAPLKPCLTLPPDLAPDIYAVHFVVYTPADGRRLPVLEQTVSWGDALVLAVVDVQRHDVSTFREWAEQYSLAYKRWRPFPECWSRFAHSYFCATIGGHDLQTFAKQKGAFSCPVRIVPALPVLLTCTSIAWRRNLANMPRCNGWPAPTPPLPALNCASRPIHAIGTASRLWTSWGCPRRMTTIAPCSNGKSSTLCSFVARMPAMLRWRKPVQRRAHTWWWKNRWRTRWPAACVWCAPARRRA
jgi:hypothetical protein